MHFSSENLNKGCNDTKILLQNLTFNQATNLWIFVQFKDRLFHLSIRVLLVHLVKSSGALVNFLIVKVFKVVVLKKSN